MSHCMGKRRYTECTPLLLNRLSPCTMKSQRAFQNAVILLLGSVLCLLSVPSIPVLAQTLDVRFKDAVASKEALSQSDLRKKMVDNLIVQYDGDVPLVGRMLVVRLEKGRVVDSRLSDSFPLAPGATALPGDAVPEADWFPDGAGALQASGFGGIDWVLSWFGEEEVDYDPVPPPPSPETDEEKRERILQNYMRGHGELPPDFFTTSGGGSSAGSSIVVTVLPGSSSAREGAAMTVPFVGITLQ